MIAIIHVMLVALFIAAADGGNPPRATRSDVDAALARAPGPDELRRLADSAEPILIAIADDRAAPAASRGRALAALAYARSGRSHAFLENFIIRETPSREPVDLLLLRRAAMALGWRSGPRLTEVLAPLLESEDRDVRLDAAAALGLGRARDAERPLRARLAVETDAAVKQQIEAALRAVAPPAAPAAH
jgi:HEAT repeat protein